MCVCRDPVSGAQGWMPHSQPDQPQNLACGVAPGTNFLDCCTGGVACSTRGELLGGCDASVQICSIRLNLHGYGAATTACSAAVQSDFVAALHT